MDDIRKLICCWFRESLEKIAYSCLDMQLVRHKINVSVLDIEILYCCVIDECSSEEVQERREAKEFVNFLLQCVPKQGNLFLCCCVVQCLSK